MLSQAVHRYFPRLASAVRSARVRRRGTTRSAWRAGLPAATVYAFDIDPLATRLCRHLAALNGVGERVVTAGACTVETLQARLEPGALLICDCEGFEDELLDPSRVPALERAEVLVELHDHLRPGISQRIKERFAHTHVVRMISAVPRDGSAAARLELPSPEDRVLAVNEFRPAPQQWAWLVPV